MSGAGDSPKEPTEETLRDALAGRFASLVYVMRGRRSIFSRLGVLELDAGVVTLSDSAGGKLFVAPVEGVECHPQRRLAVHQIFFQVRVDGHSWFLAAYSPTNYQRASTRELAERADARQFAPRPGGMDVETYERLSNNPSAQLMLWVACWVQALNRASGSDAPS